MAESLFQFVADGPPTFLGHAEDDTATPVALARNVQQQLQELAVPVNLLVIRKEDMVRSVITLMDSASTGRMRWRPG